MFDKIILDRSWNVNRFCMSLFLTSKRKAQQKKSLPDDKLQTRQNFLLKSLFACENI